MGLEEDNALVRAAVQRDPAFAGLSLDAQLAEMDGAKTSDAFLLAAMRVLATAGNGHSRVIPNAAIRVWPVRIVARREGFDLCQNGQRHRLQSVNGEPVSAVQSRMRPYLAGTAARQSVIGAILLAWPAGLGADSVVYGVGDHDVCFGAGDTVPARAFYPVAETGMTRPGEDDFAGPACIWWDKGVWRIRLAQFTEPLPEDLLPTLLAGPTAPVLVDLRGNAGGDFTHVLPLIDGMRRGWQGARCAVLVDRFTFSAAIVAAALLHHHLGARLFGEEMGDGLQFWAEGGTCDLPQTGAQIRWSSAWHDWETGHPDATTPPSISKHMVAVGQLQITPAEGVDTVRAWLTS